MSNSDPCILIADDDPDMRQMLSAYLKSRGYETLFAPDGEKALALAEAQSLDLALVDVWMPGPSGIELARRLKALQPGLAVIIITAQGTVEDAVEAVRGGVFHYLTKPLRLERFLAVVKEALAVGQVQTQVRSRGQVKGMCKGQVQLSSRQTQVLELLGRGMTNREIAGLLGLSEKTVGHHVSAILRALGVGNRTEAVLRARELGQS